MFALACQPGLFFAGSQRQLLLWRGNQQRKVLSSLRCSGIISRRRLEGLTMTSP